MKIKFLAAASILFAIFSANVLAQAAADPPAETVATLENEKGDVMLQSHEQPFITVRNKIPAKTGDKVMVGERSVALVDYSEDGCKIKYDEPGLYTIEPRCLCAIGRDSNDEERKKRAEAGDEAPPMVATVHTAEGDIQLAETRDAPFFPAEQDQPVNEKYRLQVAKDSIARVVYNDGCTKTYDEEGVYDIAASCMCAFLWAPQRTLWPYALIPVGVAIPLLDDDGPDRRTPPVSR